MKKIFSIVLCCLIIGLILPNSGKAITAAIENNSDMAKMHQQYFNADNQQIKMIMFSLWKDAVIQLYVNKEYEQAEKELELLLTENPDDFSVFKLLIEVLLIEQKINKAISGCENFLSQNPNNLDVLLMLSQIYLDNSDPLRAKKYINRVFEVEPDNYDASIYMGQALILDNKQLQAVYYFAKAQYVKPEEISTYLNLGQIYFENNEYDAAIEQLEEGLKNNQNNLELLELLAFSYAAVNKNNKAIKTSENILALDPNNDRVRIELARIYLSKEKYHKASKVLEQVSESQDYVYQKNIMLAFAYGALAKISKISFIMSTHPGVFAIIIGSVVLLFLFSLGLIGALFVAAFLIGKKTRHKPIKFKNIHWSLPQAFFVCIVLFTLPLVFEVLLGGIVYNNWLLFLSPTKNMQSSSGQNSLLAQFITVVLTSGIVFWFAIKRNGQSLRDLGFRWVRIKKFAFLAILSILMIFLFNALYMGLFSVLSGAYPEQQFIVQLIAKAGNSGHMVGLFLFAVIVSPFAEEIIFRGFIYSGLRRHCGFVAAGIISSFIFGIFHLQGSLFLPIAFMGFVLAWLFERTRSILPAVIVHMLWNLITFLNLIFLS
ncbi:MAG: tetratricopeptide repeat protein [Candidatus Omnitrophota bacterium]